MVSRCLTFSGLGTHSRRNEISIREVEVHCSHLMLGLKASLDQDDARPHSASIHIQGLISSEIRMVEVYPRLLMSENLSHTLILACRLRLTRVTLNLFRSSTYIRGVIRCIIYLRLLVCIFTLIHGLNSLYGRC